MTVPPVIAQGGVPPFVVGVWGQGDAIIPFADYDGVRWRSSWPQAVESDPDVRPLRRVPAAWWGRGSFHPTWELLEPDGNRRSIRVTGTTLAALGSSCSSNVGLETEVPPNTYQYGTVLASDHAGVIDPVQPLTSRTAEWRSVSAVLPGIYEQHEPGAWKEVPEDWRPDLTVPYRPTLDAAYLFTDVSGQFVYFESSRTFARRSNQRGDQHSFIQGWLWRRSTSSLLQTVTVKATVTDPDHKGESSFRPLGVARHGSRRFWLGTLWSYAYSGLTVIDVRRAGIKAVLVVDYPGC